jgi:hypothetical protein
MAAAPSTKRARVSEVSEDDVIHFGRILMSDDPFKHRAPKEEDAAFRALFGCKPLIILKLWNLLAENDLIPDGVRMTHLLWTFIYCKQYPKWKTMSMLTKADQKTIRKFIRDILYNVELLEGEVVSLSHGSLAL